MTHVCLFGQSVRNGVKRLMVRSAVRQCVTNFWPRPRVFGSAQPLMMTSGAHLLTAVASSRDVTASHPFDCCFEQQRRCGVTHLLTAVACSRDIAAQQQLHGVHRTSSVHSTPASGVEYIAPAASHVTRAPVVECLVPAPAACYVALVVECTAQAVSHVTPTPVDDCMTPVASAMVAPAPVDERITPATVEEAAPAPVFVYYTLAPVRSAAHVPMDECNCASACSRCGTSIHG